LEKSEAVREGGCVKSVLKNALVDSHPIVPAVIQAPFADFAV